MRQTLNTQLVRAGLIAVASAVTAGSVGCSSSRNESTRLALDTATTQPTQARVSSNVKAPLFAALPSNPMVRGSLAFPTGDPRTSAVVLEKAIPAEVITGKPYIYELVVRNVSATRLDNVSIMETLPAGLTLAEKVDGAALTIDQDRAYLKVGSLEPGESRTLKVGATANEEGAVSAATSVTYDSMLSMGVKAVTPALAMTKTLPADVLVCERVPLKISLTNSGTGTARNVTLQDVLPEGITTADGKPNIFLSLGDLVAGETKNIELPLKLMKAGKFSNTATATADDGLKAEATASMSAHQAVLELEKTGPKQQYVGVPYVYDITVTNKGDADATNVVLTNILPTGLEAMAASDGGKIEDGHVSWNLGVLNRNTAKQLRITVKGTASGTAHNTVSAQADCAAVAVVSADTALIGVPSIRLEVTEDPNPVVIGSDTTYTIVVINEGSAAATNVKLTSELESQMEYISSTGATTGKRDGTKLDFAAIASLAPQARVAYQVVVRAMEPGEVQFKTSLTSDQLGRPMEELESTTFYK